MTDPAEHERIVTANGARPGTAAYVLIEEIDHFLNRMSNRATSSFRTMQDGQSPGAHNTALPRVWVPEHPRRATRKS